MKNLIPLFLLTFFLQGCFPGSNKSESEKFIDNEKQELLVGTWILDKYNNQKIESESEKTKLRFSDNGNARSWLGDAERSGKWCFVDSARVILLNEGNVGERLEIVNLTASELSYKTKNGENKVTLSFVKLR